MVSFGLAVDDSGESRIDLGGYQLDGFYDEMFRPDGTLRPAYEGFSSAISGWSREELLRRKRMAERSLLNRGITFQVYGDASRKEQIFPFDAIPRIIEAKDRAPGPGREIRLEATAGVEGQNHKGKTRKDDGPFQTGDASEDEPT
jgi:hypothetical protein